MSSDPLAAELLELYAAYKSAVYCNLFVGIVFGAYVVLYSTSLYILLRRDGLLRSTPRMFMLCVTSTMFILGLVALVLETTLGLQQIIIQLNPSSGSIWSSHRTDVVIAVGATITRIIYIMSDIVCAWRASVLWNHDRRVIALLTLFILGTMAAAGSDLGLSLRPLFSPSHHSIQDDSNRKLGERALIMVGPTLGTNVLSTSLIGIKAWQHRRTLQKNLGASSAAIRIEKLFALLIESGFVYCCLWILYLISAFRVFPEPGFTVMDAVLLYVSGLYPTVIIIFVLLHKSPSSVITDAYSTSTDFSRRPELTTVEARMPMSAVYMQGNSYADSEDTALPSSPPFKSKQ
ncbi:hypothetical protein BC834DRAFT_1035748 [Gloeopeniophorella convolvens]|nr:hypothetical protein BC834DRAFT_1035748 [Gloeopeniophorella convolvens]